MSEPDLSDNFKTWDVKLIWVVNYPSRIFHPGAVVPREFEIYGTDRSSISISRPLTKINSLEQGGQGWIDGIPDIRITLFAKESGQSFEQLRRLSVKKIPFDVQLNLASTVITQNLQDNPHEGIWIVGYEEFLGCRVTAERSNYAIAEMPIREFECMCLRHFIKDGDIIDGDKNIISFEGLIEGDGTYDTEWP